MLRASGRLLIPTWSRSTTSSSPSCCFRHRRSGTRIPARSLLADHLDAGGLARLETRSDARALSGRRAARGALRPVGRPRHRLHRRAGGRRHHRRPRQSLRAAVDVQRPGPSAGFRAGPAARRRDPGRRWSILAQTVQAGWRSLVEEVAPGAAGGAGGESAAGAGGRHSRASIAGSSASGKSSGGHMCGIVGIVGQKSGQSAAL